jgi:CHASE3 domain sensor protein
MHSPLKLELERTMSDDRVEAQLDYWRDLSWAAIIFGALLALSVSVMLHILGIGVTASSVDTNQRASDALYTLGGVSGIWNLAATAVSLFIGGFVASTLARTFTSGRAAIYGLGVWAITTLVATAVIVPTLLNGAGNAIGAAGTVADRAAQALGSATSGAASGVSQLLPSGIADRVQRTLIGNNAGEVDQNALQQITTLIGQRAKGDWTPQQRAQLNDAVAKAAKISPDDARRRVDEAENTINSAIQQASETARRAADVTRQTAEGASFWVFASMLIGLIAAIFGASYGERDEKDLPAFVRLRSSERPRPLSPGE